MNNSNNSQYQAPHVQGDNAGYNYYGLWPIPQPHQEQADYPALAYPDEDDDQGKYYGVEYYDEPEGGDPQTHRERRRNRRRHDGIRGPRVTARPHNPRRPLLDIVQPVINGADMTMEMSLNAFDAILERQLGGYVPGMDFKDRTGASITGLKNLEGQNATIVIKGSHTQVAAAYGLLLDHNLRYSIEANAEEEEHLPRRRRRRRR
ncbi:hypothetical protein BKA65DRAFT_534023 [Rhexocercosporidium sp. MPI-PUGE-AT-0058]|nr:hypothetical protein BKA65DRAFT_534023 [Rhexocercosporidium sp. MPI-PUGE-AT-0058]